MGHIEEVCKGNLGNPAEDPICEDIDGQQSVRLDEFEAFTDDYSTYDDFDVEYSVPNGEDNQVEMEILEGMVSDDSGDAFYSRNGDGSDYSGDDSDDSDYIVHESNFPFDVDVDMSESQSVMDVDEHGILNKQTESIANDIVDEELEVIQSDDYQYAGFYEDERTKMLKELSNPKIPIKALHEELCKKLELVASKPAWELQTQPHQRRNDYTTHTHTSLLGDKHNHPPRGGVRRRQWHWKAATTTSNGGG
ncbi:unnamed protein product [Lactuca saligna]|uniref:Uncharacterized protein n=1 Tax=Lactuca saligna TaxID=75948 RepID=A0AA35Z483_LACSI|nr:unnamed protein product [Lactuca saligna]